MMKKILLCLLLLSVGAGVLSCSSDTVDYDDLLAKNEEGVSPLESLLEKSLLLNEIYYGEGIDTKKDAPLKGVYKEADLSSLEEYGMTDIASIKEKTEEVFSPAMCNSLYSRVFESYRMGTEVSRVRYYEDDEGLLMVRTTTESILNGDITYDCSTIEYQSQRKGRVTFTMEATVTIEDGSSRTDRIRVVVQKTKDGWRLDSPTYLVYYAE